MRWNSCVMNQEQNIIHARSVEVMVAGWFILPEKETDIIIQLSAAD